MSDIVIRTEHLSKQYIRGAIGSTTRQAALASKRARPMAKPDPNAPPGEARRQKPKKFLALDDVSFEVERGDAFGIVGENGSGKSTLLKILSGITTPTSGSVMITGKVASLLEVGTGFHPEMTGRENVYLNGAILGLKKEEIDCLFDDIVIFSEIGDFIDTPVKRYSSGMYVRLAFSVAAHLESDIVILDEVLAVGDARFQRKCLKKIEGILQDKTRTVLFVSHDASAVGRLCNKCIHLHQGRLVSIGSTEKIITEYAEAVLRDEPPETLCFKTVWDSPATAPQNGFFVMTACWVCDREGNETDRITSDDDFYVTIEYKAKYTGATAAFSLVAFDNGGSILFGSINNHDSAYEKPLTKGKTYRAICRINGGLLNQGIFGFGISYFGAHYEDADYCKDVLRIKIEDGSGLRGDYKGTFDGSFRPRLDWTSKEEI